MLLSEQLTLLKGPTEATESSAKLVIVTPMFAGNVFAMRYTRGPSYYPNFAGRALGLVTACLAVTGCALLATPPKVVVEKAVLSEVPHDLPQRTPRGETVLVFAPKATGLYDTTQMAYSTRPHEVAYFSEREWAATPSQMLYPLVVRTLENTHAFRAVLTEPITARYTYALRTDILELIQDFSPDSATLLLSLRFQLTDYALNSFHPVWSPDGKRLVFSTGTPETDNGISVLDLPD